MPPSEPEPSVRRPSRRLRRRVLLAAVGGVLLTLIAYASLPLWLSERWLARRLERDLTEQIGRPARIGSAEIGWIRGVIIKDLSVDGRPETAHPLLARVGEIRCEFSPLQILHSRTVDRLEIEDPELFLTFDEDGRLVGVDDLAHLLEAPPPTSHCGVRRAVLRVSGPHAAAAIRIDEMKCTFDSDEALIHIAGSTRVEDQVTADAGSRRPQVSFEASLESPQLQPQSGRALQGNVRVDWNDISMDDLLRMIQLQIPIEQIKGTTSGKSELVVHPDITIDFDLSVAFDGVRLKEREGHHSAEIPSATIAAEGRWDPKLDLLDVKTVRMDTPALHLFHDGSSTSSALRIDPKGNIPFEMQLKGRIKDLGRLREELPGFSANLLSTWGSFEGPADLQLAVRRERDRPRPVAYYDHVHIEVDAASSLWHIHDGAQTYLRAGPGLAKSLDLRLHRAHDDPGQLDAELDLHLGAIDVRAHARSPYSRPLVANPRQWLASMAPGLAVELDVQTSRLEQLPSLFPALVHEKAPPASWRGPFKANLSITPGPNASVIRAEVNAGAESAFVIAPDLLKPPGRAFRVEAGLTIPHSPDDQIRLIHMSVEHGAGRCRLDPASAKLRARWHDLSLTRESITSPDSADDGPLLDARVESTWNIEHIEDLLTLLPRVDRRFDGSDMPEIRGDAVVRCEGLLSLRPRDGRLQGTLELDATRLDLLYRDLLHKPPGDELTLRIGGLISTLHDEREIAAWFDANLPSARLAGSWIHAERINSASDVPFDRLRFELTAADLRKAMGISPLILRELSPLQPQGPMRLTLSGYSDRKDSVIEIHADASDAGFALTRELDGPVKPFGVPAHLDLELRFESEREDGGPTRCRMARGSARLAGLELNRLTGVLAIDRGEYDDQKSPSVMGNLSGDLTLNLDSDRAILPHAWAVLRDELGLSGGSRVAFETAFAGNHVDLSAEIDLTGSTITVEFDNPAAPMIGKSIGTPALATLQLAADRIGDSINLTCTDATLRLSDNRVRATGETTLVRDSEGTWRAEHLTLTTLIDLLDLEQIGALIGDDPLRSIAGSARIRSTISHREGQTTYDQVDIALDDVSIRLDTGHVVVAGRLSVGEQLVEVDNLRWSVGESSGSITGSLLQKEMEAEWGKQAAIALVARKLSVNEMLPVVRAVRSLAAETSPPVEPPGAGRPAWFAFVPETDFLAQLHIDQLDFVLPPEVDVRAEAVVNHAVLADGQLDMTFRSVVNGGVVSGFLTTDFTTDDPVLYFSYTADGIQPGPLVDLYLAHTFPGMTATGPLTLIDESYLKWFPPPGDPNHETGQGQLMIEGGTIEGRAAPIWMTRIFPGLNLARFPFTYMHSWFDKKADGRIYHRMIYIGTYYNIYTDGYADADGNINYEAGIDFFADFDSQYWAHTGQGRIPLFTKTGRVAPDGTILDEQVEYVPRRFIQSLLVGNNPLVTAYHAVRKRVLGHD